MAKQEKQVFFTFEDPNEEGRFEQVLRMVLIEKLTAPQPEQKKSGRANGGTG